jgi:hypothetical protein
MIRLSMTEEHPTDEYGQMGLFPADKFKVGDKVWWNGNICMTGTGTTILQNYACADKEYSHNEFPRKVVILDMYNNYLGIKDKIAYKISYDNWWVWPKDLAFNKEDL